MQKLIASIASSALLFAGLVGLAPGASASYSVDVTGPVTVVNDGVEFEVKGSRNSDFPYDAHSSSFMQCGYADATGKNFSGSTQDYKNQIFLELQAEIYASEEYQYCLDNPDIFVEEIKSTYEPFTSAGGEVQCSNSSSYGYCYAKFKYVAPPLDYSGVKVFTAPVTDLSYAEWLSDGPSYLLEKEEILIPWEFEQVGEELTLATDVEELPALLGAQDGKAVVNTNKSDKDSLRQVTLPSDYGFAVGDVIVLKQGDDFVAAVVTSNENGAMLVAHSEAVMNIPGANALNIGDPVSIGKLPQVFTPGVQEKLLAKVPGAKPGDPIAVMVQTRTVAPEGMVYYDSNSKEFKPREYKWTTAKNDNGLTMTFTEPILSPTKVQLLAANEDDPQYESLTPAWTSVRGDSCADGQYDSVLEGGTGTCALGDVSYNGNVWDETLRLVFTTENDANAIGAIEFEDKNGVKLQGVTQAIIGNGDPKVHVRLPQGLAEGDVTMRLLLNGLESYPISIGVLNRTSLKRDLIAAKYADLEKSDLFQGQANYYCQGIGDFNTITFEDIDFKIDCNNYYNSYNDNSGTPGLALPYQVYELEGVTDSTYRFKPHCVEGYMAYWGNRTGPNSTSTYGCIPTPETCEEIGGEWTSYTHPYGYEAFYCNLYGVPDFEVTLTGPTEVQVGDSVSYELVVSGDSGLQKGTVFVTSRDEVVETVSIDTNKSYNEMTWYFNVDVPFVEAETKEDLVFPIQAFYRAQDKIDPAKILDFESAVLVTTIAPDPEMCLAFGSDPGITARSADIDGDGVVNVADSDMDGDGVPNTEDPDIDGDGTDNAADGEPEGPPARPVPPSLLDEEQQQDLAWKIQDHIYGEDYPSTFPLPVDPDSGEEETFAEGAGVIVPAPSYEAVTEVLQYAVDDVCGIDNNWDGNAGGVDPGTGGGTDGGTDGGTTPPGAYPILGDGGSNNGEEATGGKAPSLTLILPSQVYKGVETTLNAEVDAKSGVVEFGVQEIDLEGNQSVRILGSSVVEDGKASLDLTPKAYGDAIVYARYTGDRGTDTTAGATVVYPAPFIDEFILKVNGDYWTQMPKGEVLPYGYSKLEWTTDSGETPRVKVSGPCELVSPKKIVGKKIAPSRCRIEVTTGGFGAFAEKTWVFDVALSMGSQEAKKGGKNTKPNYKFDGQKIKNGYAPKVKGKYKSYRA